MSVDTKDYLKGFFQRSLFRLNDSLAVTQLTAWSVREFLLGKIDTPHAILVPLANNQVWPFERSAAQVRQLMEYEVSTGQYERSLVFLIAEVEDLIASIIRIILTAHPKELMIGLKEGESDALVPLSSVVNATDLETLLKRHIEFRISKIMRERPKDFLTYLAARLRVSLKKGQASPTIKRSTLGDSIDRYCEISATRDMVVHNGRKATRDYVDKASPAYRRAKAGEILAVDEEYFGKSVAHIKKLCEELEEAMLEEYGEDVGILDSLTNLGLLAPFDPQHGTLTDSPPKKAM